jgi:tetratricopeptide (TPR) repeat protein
MRYAEAAAAFEDAFRFLPTSALAANNAGFDHYKLGAYDAAATWFEKTIAVDPKRAIAHANLGDAYLKLGRTDEARKAYERYLELAPNSKLAPTLRKRLESPTLATRGDGG